MAATSRALLNALGLFQRLVVCAWSLSAAAVRRTHATQVTKGLFIYTIKKSASEFRVHYTALMSGRECRQATKDLASKAATSSSETQHSNGGQQQLHARLPGLPSASPREPFLLHGVGDAGTGSFESVPDRLLWDTIHHRSRWLAPRATLSCAPT